jgi:hypothetical protein
VTAIYVAVTCLFVLELLIPAKKCQLDPGETRTLEIKTSDKSDKNGLFVPMLVFAEGCKLSATVQN